MSLKPVVHAILAPIVINPLGLENIEPEWSRKVKVERLAKIVRNDLEEAATDYEAMLYLHSQSFVAPLPETWLHVYFWLFWQFYPDQAKTFLEKVELHHLEEEELNRLKRWIYRKQKEALRQRRKVRSTPHPPPPAKLGQATLFAL